MVVTSTFFQFQYHQILKFIYPSSYTIKKFVLCSIFLVELTFCFKFISLTFVNSINHTAIISIFNVTRHLHETIAFIMYKHLFKKCVLDLSKIKLYEFIKTKYFRSSYFYSN